MRYGALIYREEEEKMRKNNSLFRDFRQIYNKTIKECLNLPTKAPHDKMDILMGT
jgi:hypothetical protein